MTTINIEIKGGSFTEEQVDKLVNDINNMLSEGDLIVIPKPSLFTRFLNWVYS